MNELSLKSTNETKKLLSKQLQREIFSDYIWLFATILINIAFYIFTYFKHQYIWEEGDILVVILQLTWACGSVIFYQSNKIYKKVNGNRQDFDEQPNYEGSFLGSYQYDSLQESSQGIFSLPGICGIVNLIIYLVFFIILLNLF